MNWTLTLWDPDKGKEIYFDLGDSVDGEKITVRPVRGASALHVELRLNGEARLRAEISVDEDDEVDLLLHHRDELLDLDTSDDRQVTILPTDKVYRPSPPIHVGSGSDQLDVAVIVDTTMHHWEAPSEDEVQVDSPPRRLLAESPERQEVLGGLLLLLDELDERIDSLRVAVLSFGDEGIEGGTGDLVPEIHLGPEGRLRTYERDAVGRILAGLRASSGADLVDAVGDALAATVSLRWRASARRLVVLVGESPGHSLLDPVPGPIDAKARRRDVFVEAQRLHEKRCLIATLYVRPPSEAWEFLAAKPQGKDILRGIQAQYRKLATTPSLAQVVSAPGVVEALELMEALGELEGTYARGAAFPGIARQNE